MQHLVDLSKVHGGVGAFQVSNQQLNMLAEDSQNPSTAMRSKKVELMASGAGARSKSSITGMKIINTTAQLSTNSQQDEDAIEVQKNNSRPKKGQTAAVAT